MKPIGEIPVKKSLMIFSIAGMAGCTSLTPAEDPVFLKLTDLEARLLRVERVVQNESLIQLSTQLDRLQSETQALRGEIETMRFESQNSAEGQRNLYLDLDSRIQSIEDSQTRISEQARAAAITSERAAAVADAAATAAAEPPPVVHPLGNDQDNYNAAFELIQDRRYQEAAVAFRDFLQYFPGSPLSDNAQYWLAETYYVQRQFAEALPEFQRVLDLYPESAKLADALLKVGYCNYELRQWSAARRALERVSSDYPDTTAARLAVQRLERLAQEEG